MKRVYLLVLSVALIGFVSACSGPRPLGREKGILTGGAIGGGLGAIIGSRSGHAGAGTAIGGAFGSLAGGVLGNAFDADDARAKEQEEKAQRLEAELRRQRREIEDLKKQLKQRADAGVSHSQQNAVPPLT